MKNWGIGAAVLIVIIVLLTSIPPMLRRRPGGSSSLRPLTLEEVKLSPALTYAAERYFERGGRYIWGTNDCSVFVSDYLIKRIPAIKQRFTTAGFDSIYISDHGFEDATKPKAGDVINYRYLSKKTNQTAGHCGVVWQRLDGMFVIHNCLSKGLVIQPYVDFVATAVALGTPKSEIRLLRHPASLVTASKGTQARPPAKDKR